MQDGDICTYIHGHTGMHYTHPLGLENVPEALQHPGIPIGQAVCPLTLQPDLHEAVNQGVLQQSHRVKSISEQAKVVRSLMCHAHSQSSLYYLNGY